MKKRVILVLILFSLLGILILSLNAFAYSGSRNSDKNNSINSETNDNSDNDSENESDDSGSDFDENEIENEVKRRFIDENGIEHKIKISMGEKNRIKVENEENEGEFESELNISEFSERNITKFKVKLKNGNETEIKVLPSTASEKARAIFESRNFTLILKEINHKNIPRVVYHIEGNKTGKFLGIWKMKVKIQGDVDAETGEVLNKNVPWWAFLLFGDDDETPNEPPTNTTNQNNTNTNQTNTNTTITNQTNQNNTEINNTNINETIVNTTNSST